MNSVIELKPTYYDRFRCIASARRYSAEIEYSDENPEALLEALDAEKTEER